MNKFNNIDEAVEYISSKRNKNMGLDRFRKIMNDFNNPQDDFKVIHIAGTNGKGSTVNFIKDMLVINGYKVGTFTSPHLIKHQDRIRINNEWISDERLLEYVNEYYTLIEEENLNMFEIDTLIMCQYFKENNVDFGIVETGIGGRLDSTNIFKKPLLEIITTIGYDHTERLGNTLDKIAYEKAGIIKPNTKVVAGNLQNIAMKVIFEKCEEVNSQLYLLRPYKMIAENKFMYEKEVYEIENNGTFFIENACIALEAIQLLDLKLDKKLIKSAIKKSIWPGRFELVSKNPRIILDGAHNIEGVKALIASMKNTKKPHVVVFGALQDKPAKAMAKLLSENVDSVIITQFEFYRAMKANDIATNLDVLVVRDFREAIKLGIEKSHDGTLFICGSLYFISIVRKYILNQD